MAAGTFTLFGANKDDLRLNDLAGSGNLRMALVGSAYTPNSSESGHSVWADISANEIANGNGYTTGGVALSSVVATAISGGFKLASANPSWTASGAGLPAFRYGVLYYLGSLWGKTNPIIGYFVGDATPADIPLTASGQTLTLACPSGGWFDAV
jgi:hypothetical protein